MINRFMWLLVMFDLPVKEKEDRKQYTRFRHDIIKLGFDRLQYSIYTSPFYDDKRSEFMINTIKDIVPPKGEVRILKVTNHQFAQMQLFFNNKKIIEKKSKEIEQLVFL